MRASRMIDRASAPFVILLAPGAGAGSESAWMRGWRDRLAAADLGTAVVETFDYPYRLAGRKAPDKLPVLIAAHREALASLRARHPRARVVLAGKSMGGRVGCHVALVEPVDALICLGYPLVGGAGALRDEVLLVLRTPVLFCQGARDPLCPLDKLAGVRERMTAPNQLVVVEGGNHSLEVSRKRPTSGKGHDAAVSASTGANPNPQDGADALVLEAIRAFVRPVHGADRPP
jgi:predicted alpha/beta-hydrolase family hydrolase